MANALTGFLFENHVAHGAFVEIDEGLESMLQHRAYSPDVEALVAQVMAALPLLATHLRNEGRINLQFQGQGAISLLVGQIDHQLQLRAMAKAPAVLEGSFRELMAGGVLALMLEPADSRQPSAQAMVSIDGDSLAESLEGYFARSEQLPTLMRLAYGAGRVHGFLLQRLPLENARGDEDSWRRLWHLASTLGSEELLSQSPRTLVKRLFPEDDLRLLPSREISVSCRCSSDGISRMLLSLGREEVESIVAEQGQVSVTCEFCGREYHFGALQVQVMFAAAAMQPHETRH